MHRVLVLALLIGCTPATYSFTPASARALSAKPENCPIEVVTGTPTKDYEDLGALEHYNGDPPKNADEFKKAVNRQVCLAGGDAVIAITNEKGLYTKGTVVHWVPTMATPLKPATNLPPPPPPQEKDTEVPK